jgi:acyl carrier protein
MQKTSRETGSRQRAAKVRVPRFVNVSSGGCVTMIGSQAELDTAPDRVASVATTVLKVLHGIRARQSSGAGYDETTRLADAGFTSMDMVKVMLGVEAAFDLMIPQDQVTPENFRDARSITAMIARLMPAA